VPATCGSVARMKLFWTIVLGMLVPQLVPLLLILWTQPIGRRFK
jgi:hypothetical protein